MLCGTGPETMKGYWMLDEIDRKKLHRKQVTWVAIFAIVFIPLFTWLFATSESPADYTFSMIGNTLGHRLSFILWGVVTGLLLGFYVLRLFILKSFRDTRARKLLLWSLVFLVLTVLIPSLESTYIINRLHDFTAVAFALCLVFSLYLFIRHLHEREQELYSWSLIMFHVVVGGSLLLLLLFGMTGIFQLFFFVSLSVFLAVLNRKLFRGRDRTWEED